MLTLYKIGDILHYKSNGTAWAWLTISYIC